MVITESELRELWRDGNHALPAFPPGTRFSPAAQDFLKEHDLIIQFVSPVILNPKIENPQWDRPATFPVIFSGPVPVCAVCGQPLERTKADHLTQLDATHFAPKTHPRIKLRGQIDSLHALMLLAAAEARRYQLPKLAEGIDTLAAFCREVQSAEYHGRAVQPLVLNDKNENELHQISHWPDRHLGIPHLVSESRDHAILHWLNVVRTQTRELELTALEVYGPKEHTHEDTESPGSIPHALNRMSSAVYILALLFRRGDLGWRV